MSQDFLHAPPDHLRTWTGFTRFALIASIGVAMLLGLLAIFLL